MKQKKVSDEASSDTVKSDTVKSDTVKSDTVKSDTVKSDTVKSDTVKSDTVKGEELTKKLLKKRTLKEMKQICFLPKVKKSFGPEDLMGKRKVARVLSSRHAIHLILKSDVIEELGTFYKYKKLISSELNKFAVKFGVRVYNHAINRDHIHLAVQIQNREQYKKFIAAFTGSVAKKILKLNTFSNRNKTLAPPQSLEITSASRQIFAPVGKIKFWKARPFTRVLEWGKDFQTTQTYLYQNKMESLGVAKYEERNACTIIERTKFFTDQIYIGEQLTSEEFFKEEMQLQLPST